MTQATTVCQKFQHVFLISHHVGRGEDKLILVNLGKVERRCKREEEEVYKLYIVELCGLRRSSHFIDGGTEVSIWSQIE